MTAAALVVDKWYRERRTGQEVCYLGYSRHDGRTYYQFRYRRGLTSFYLDPADVDEI